MSRAPCAHSPVPAVTTAYPGSQVARTLGTLPWLLHSLAAPAAATGGGGYWCGTWEARRLRLRAGCTAMVAHSAPATTCTGR